MDSRIFIKTGIMVGLGEETEEIVELIGHAVEAGVDILTIGQYLRPSMKHAEIKKYYHPDEFAELREIGRPLGIRWVFSGPLVRSSYHAEDVFDQMIAQRVERLQLHDRRAMIVTNPECDWRRRVVYEHPPDIREPG